jgi:hypothetical protein
MSSQVPYSGHPTRPPKGDRCLVGSKSDSVGSVGRQLSGQGGEKDRTGIFRGSFCLPAKNDPKARGSDRRGPARPLGVVPDHDRADESGLPHRRPVAIGPSRASCSAAGSREALPTGGAGACSVRCVASCRRACRAGPEGPPAALSGPLAHRARSERSALARGISSRASDQLCRKAVGPIGDP